ncbi:DUF1850 family protein [Halanaeroarchaeum sp. HSR-CO]|uniref:DUF1850 domain-containing protein n=1 Tax=Halanaeroarchaeum sp. HSR-CO TaxID=2866382 RepID=UPI00217EEF82|nr:DUF1850 domain-containing protein [Halanaeroarchaeum sp. HSR-CO]UWG47267.1 DUF1850 family protein [Halanaeroarchaeum sp. HSR-CO]
MTPPRPSRRLLVVAVAVLVVAVALATAAQAAASPVLVVSGQETGEELLVTEVDDGTTVTLEYMHSVEKTTVRDVYVVEGDSLRMTRMEFSSFGWGLPARADIDGRTTDGEFYITFEDRTYERLDVVPGTVAGHTLVVGDEEYDLVERSDASAVQITVERDRPLRTLLAYT